MVFATESYPLAQSLPPQTDRAKAAQDRESSIELGQSKLSQSIQTDFLLGQAAQAQAVQVKVVRADGDRASSKVVTLHRKPAAQPALQVQSSTLPLPSKPKLPFGLQVLNRVQQGSAAIAGILVTGALVVYGSTVYVDKSNSYTLAQLDALQSESQQLTSANEAIKQSLAEQAAQADSGLALHKSGDVLFLSPEPLREIPAEPAEPATKRTRPLGY